MTRIAIALAAALFAFSTAAQQQPPKEAQSGTPKGTQSGTPSEQKDEQRAASAADAGEKAPAKTEGSAASGSTTTEQKPQSPPAPPKRQQ